MNERGQGCIREFEGRVEDENDLRSGLDEVVHQLALELLHAQYLILQELGSIKRHLESRVTLVLPGGEESLPVLVEVNDDGDDLAEALRCEVDTTLRRADFAFDE